MLQLVVNSTGVMVPDVTSVMMVGVTGLLPGTDAAGRPVQQARSGSASVLSDEAAWHSAQCHHLWQLQQGQFSQFVWNFSSPHLSHVCSLVVENPDI